MLICVLRLDHCTEMIHTVHSHMLIVCVQLLRTGLKNLFYYVDNYIHVTPNTGKTTALNADLNKLLLLRELKKSGLLFHQLEGPTHCLLFLGWVIDTGNMTVAITKERREWIITLLDEWLNKTTFLLKDLSSLIGIMMFLAQVLGV